MDDIDRSNCGGAARVKAYLEYIQNRKVRIGQQVYKYLFIRILL